MKNQKPRGNLGISRAPSYWSKRALLVTDTWTPRTFGRYWLHPRAWKTDGTKGIHLLRDRWFSKVLRAGSALLKSQRIEGCRLHEGRTSIYRVLELKPLKPMLSLAKPRSQMTSKGQLQTGGAIRAEWNASLLKASVML